METVQQDLEAFRARVLNVEQLLDQVETQVRDDYGGKSGIHPGHVNATRNHFQELYSKLKFSFIELSSKKNFMNDISQDPPVMATEDMVTSLEAENKAAAIELKKAKRHIESLRDTLGNSVYNIVSARDETRQIVNDTLQLLTDTQAMEEELKTVEEMINNHEQITGEEAERILNEQKLQLQNVYAETDEQQREVDDLQWELDMAQQELAQLEKEQQTTESLAVEANRIAKQSDPRVQEMHSWYQSATATLLQLVGVKQFHMDSRDTLLVHYDTASSSSSSSSSSFESMELRVQLDPITFRLQDAQWTSTQVADQLNIDDIVAYACQRDSLPLLLWQIHRRITTTTTTTTTTSTDESMD